MRKRVSTVLAMCIAAIGRTVPPAEHVDQGGLASNGRSLPEPARE
jgi:hypothetical protein